MCALKLGRRSHVNLRGRAAGRTYAIPTPQMELFATIAISPAHRVPCLDENSMVSARRQFERLLILVGRVVSRTGIVIVIVQIVAREWVVVGDDVGIVPFEAVVENADLDSLAGVASCPCG
jgi:hypothetical protein